MQLPAAVLAWAASVLGTAISDHRELHGGVDATTAALDLADGRTVVLRMASDPSRDSPVRLARTAAFLTAVEATMLPAPALLALDVEGEHAGRPALVMTFLPGSPQPFLHDPLVAARTVMELLPAVHALTVPDLPELSGTDVLGRPFGTFTDDALCAVAWPELARRLPPQGRPLVPVHADVWYGNLLWEGDRLTGLVDWSDGARSDPAADYAVPRSDVAILLGPDALDGLPAAQHQGFWDLRMACMYLGHVDEWWPAAAAIGWPCSAQQIRAALRQWIEALLDQ